MSGRPVRECTHPQAYHEHGTYPRYNKDGCRCPECTEANRREAVRYRLAAAHGGSKLLVPAAPAREHLAMLRSKGYGNRTLARLTGLSQATVGQIIYGIPSKGLPPQEHVTRKTLEKILAVRPALNTVPDRARVSSRATVARLQSLIALGYDMLWICNRLGGSPHLVTRLLRSETCHADNARAVRELHDHVQGQPRTATTTEEKRILARTLGYARARGWEPLPVAQPDPSLNRYLEARRTRQNRKTA